MQRHVVRRSTVYALVAAFNHQQVPIRDTGVKAHPIRAQSLIQIADQRIGLLGRDMSSGVILQHLSLHTDKVATHSHIARLQLHPHAGRL